MHEPQWSGVRRMTHFDRYEVVMDSTLWMHCLKNSEERWRYITSTETIIQLEFPD